MYRGAIALGVVCAIGCGSSSPSESLGTENSTVRGGFGSCALQVSGTPNGSRQLDLTGAAGTHGSVGLMLSDAGGGACNVDLSISPSLGTSLSLSPSRRLTILPGGSAAVTIDYTIPSASAGTTLELTSNDATHSVIPIDITLTPSSTTPPPPPGGSPCVTAADCTGYFPPLCTVCASGSEQGHQECAYAACVQGECLEELCAGPPIVVGPISNASMIP